MARHTGQPPEQVDKDLERDVYLAPQQALEYGLIDGVLDERTSHSEEE